MLVPLNLFLMYDISDFYSSVLSLSKYTIKRLITCNDTRLAADWLLNAKYVFGLMIKEWAKTAHLIGRIQSCSALFNCHLQQIRSSAGWASEEQRPDAGASSISAVLDSVCSEHGVEMGGEERDAEATPVTCNIDTIYYLLKRKRNKKTNKKKKHLHCTLGN